MIADDKWVDDADGRSLIGLVFWLMGVVTLSLQEPILLSPKPLILQSVYQKELQFEPMENPINFFHEQCIATSGILEPAVSINDCFAANEVFVPQPGITSHLCQLPLCTKIILIQCKMY